MDLKTEKVSYLCSECNQTRNLLLLASLHLQRNDLIDSGLASYTDVHSNEDGRNYHACNLSIDANFHIRTFSPLKKKETKVKSMIPGPSKKVKVSKVVSNWHSWKSLHISIQFHNSDILLENNESQEGITKEIIIKSLLESVECKLLQSVSSSADRIQYIQDWIHYLLNSLEKAPFLDKKLLILLLHFIDIHSFRRLTVIDEKFISSLLDPSALIVGNKQTLMSIEKFAEHVNFVDTTSEMVKLVNSKIMMKQKMQMTDFIQLIIENDIQFLTGFYHILMIEGVKIHLSSLIPI